MKQNLRYLKDPKINKSTAFTLEERNIYGLQGLLPWVVSDQTKQVARVMENLRNKKTDLEKYTYLSSLQDRNERLFYRTLIENIEELLPIVYTPTVGQACKEYSHLFAQTKGFYITPNDKGNITAILRNWPEKDIRVIVVTDGQRILGLGDLGANGMGIPIGKLILYTACGGINPRHCLPVMIDIGTNNDEYLTDPLYLGYPHKRLEGKAYDEIVMEFIEAVQANFPKALIQFEDFLTPNAYRILNYYKEKVLCFNDDIQGTASVALAGVLASIRITKKKVAGLKIMFLGAGSAATGIADLIAFAFKKAGLSGKEALSNLFFVDIKGLITSARTDLMTHNLPYAHPLKDMSFIEAIKEIKPDILIGATGARGAFTKEIIEAMSAINERPVIFALSNPTSKAECTAEEAYTWSNGNAVFVSGSPFANVEFKGRVYDPGQGNNAYIFPGLGLGAVACEARIITDELFLEAARTLAGIVDEKDLESGSLYPPINKIQEVSIQIAIRVAKLAYEMGLATNKKPRSIEKKIRSMVYDPVY